MKDKRNLSFLNQERYEIEFLDIGCSGSLDE